MQFLIQNYMFRDLSEGNYYKQKFITAISNKNVFLILFFNYSQYYFVLVAGVQHSG